MTATSASVQRKGQWLRLDARQFSRQLENNTMKAHSILAAGTEVNRDQQGRCYCGGKGAGGRLHTAGLSLHFIHPHPYTVQ